MYVCDNCENRVAWRGQAQGFDGQYWAYDNNSPVASLHEQWERGRDFRWYCTACYAYWWNMTDFTEVREALQLEQKQRNVGCALSTGENTNKFTAESSPKDLFCIKMKPPFIQCGLVEK